MVRKLRDNWKIDPHRIFATGISNGGMMAYRMACEMSDVIAGIAPVAGALNAHPCKPVRPVSVIAFHGTSDLHVRYEGWASRSLAGLAAPAHGHGRRKNIH